MVEVVGGILGSKKAVAALVAVLALVLIRVAGRFGVVLDQATAAELSNQVLAVASAYVIGQGIADHGKSAAEVRADAEKKPVPVVEIVEPKKP